MHILHVTYINGTEFAVTLPSDAKATDTFIVKVGTYNATVVNGKANLTPATVWVNGTLKTAELYNIADLNKVLASHNFVVKAAITATDFAAVSVVAGEIDVTMTTPATGRLVVTDSLGNEVYNSTTVVVTLDATDGLVQGATYTLKLMSGTEVLSTKTVKVMTTADGSAAADALAVADEKAALKITFTTPDTVATSITKDLVLGTATEGTTITWTSSNTDVIANDGKVTQPAAGTGDATVTMTAKIKLNAAEATKVFTVVVIDKLTQAEIDAAQAKSDADAFKADAAVSPILAKTLATVVATDDVDAAIAKHTALSPAAKALVSAEKAKLDDLKARVDAIVAVNNAADKAAMRTALEDADLGLDLTEWNALLGLQKDTVATSLLAGTFTNAGSIQTALDAAIN